MPFRIGIIGTGFAGSTHARAAIGLPDVRLAAIAAATVAEATPLAAELGARVAPDAAALCASDDVDLVVVASPTHLHAEHVIAAARAGKQVFCEKPIARTLADARAMVRACDDAGVRLAIGHVVRCFPEYRRVKELLDAGTLGRPAVATLTRGTLSVGAARAWYLDPAKSGGVVLDLMLHDLDVLRWWFGEPARVYGKRLGGGGPLDYALATLRYDDRPIVQLEASWAEHAGFRTTFEVRGDRGMIAHDSRAASPFVVQSPAGGAGAGVIPAPTLRETPYRRQLRDLVERLARGEPPLVDGREALRSLGLGLAVIESAERGEVVPWAVPA
ncbi:MAG TPA: Gfo/Idh/MocA family oxidoreductase [Candidatus Limnocylindria bacterium]|nr:Gfo/Idh/MocA family oxidoreductase [Candidatus Limnocylindria bacterium]